MRFSRLRERALRNALRHLEECGYLRTWKEGAFNRYQVLYDVPVLEVELMLAKDRHADAGVTTDKQHRHLDAGPDAPGEERHPDAAPAPGCRSDRHEDADGTGTAVPGERVLQRGTDLTATAAREEGSMSEAGTDGTRGDTIGDTGRTLSQLAIELGVAVNGALRDNPAMAAQAESYPLRSDLALTPLTDWMGEGIPFPVIVTACVRSASRFTPARKGDRISRFTYFDGVVRDEWGKVQANAQVAAAPKPAESRKIRRLA